MEPYIEINGNKAKLCGEFSPQILSDLDMELSYKPAGIEFSPAVRRGFCDGRVKLLSSNLSFAIGLVNRVVKFFEEYNIIIKIVDNNKYSQSFEIDISDKLKKLNIVPRDYQIAACEAAISKKTGIVRVCTGGGKTLIAALIVAKVGKNKKSIIYVVGKSLLWQFKELFDIIFPGQVGVIGDGVCDIKSINICSIWSVGLAFGSSKKIEDDEGTQEKKISENYYRNIRTLVSTSNVSIMDECHVAASDTMMKISREILSEYKIGMSATPSREDNTNLLIESCFGKIIINISASELIAKNYLVQPVIKFISVPKVRFPKEMNYRQIYSDYIVNNEIRNDLIVKGAISLIEQDFSTVILFKELAHGKILYDKLNEKKIDFDILSGKDSSEDRKAALDRITSGKSKLVVASSIFNLGIDCKKLSGLVNAAGGKSKISSLQKIGRILRGSIGKEMAAVIEFYDQARYLRDHSIIRKETYQQESGFKVIPCKEML